MEIIFIIVLFCTSLNVTSFIRLLWCKRFTFCSFSFRLSARTHAHTHTRSISSTKKMIEIVCHGMQRKEVISFASNFEFNTENYFESITANCFLLNRRNTGGMAWCAPCWSYYWNFHEASSRDIAKHVLQWASTYKWGRERGTCAFILPDHIGSGAQQLSDWASNRCSDHVIICFAQNRK